MTRSRRFLLGALPILLLAPAALAQIDLASLLDEMTDRAALARWPDPAYTTGQFSSYDRASVSPGDDTWWANGDAGKFLREIQRDGRTEHVMMDADGPGAIVRIWSANPKGTLRVYLDESDTPAIEAPMAELLGGSGFVPEPLAGVRSRGYNTYLPIPYATHCLVTSDEPGFYYHVNYRTYEPGTRVTTFSMQALRRNAQRLELAGAGLTTRPDVRGEAVELSESLASGANSTPIDLAGPGAVARLTVRLGTDGEIERALRSTVLEMHADGEHTVWAPVGDLASGVGLNPMSDWMRRVGDDGTTEIDWVMPFRQGATIRFHNLGDDDVRLDARAVVTPWEWDDRSMHFYATWRQQRDVHTRPRRDITYVDIKGRGVLVGDQLTITNPTKAWWGEGDEKIYVDDMSFPAHFGTGTEDYYGYAWCCPEPFQAPFHSQVRCDGAEGGNNYGTTTVSRIRSLDAIPFESHLRFDMELWHWEEVDVSYSATSFFYAIPGARIDVKPMPEEASLAPPHAPPLPPPFRIEGAIEAENLTVVERAAGVQAGPQGGFGPDTWSNEQQLWIRAAKPGDYVVIEVPVQLEGPVRVDVVLTKSWDYGIVRFSHKGRPVGRPVDLWCGEPREVRRTEPIPLGVFTPDHGVIELRAELVGANAEAEPPRSYFGIDCFLALPAGTRR